MHIESPGRVTLEEVFKLGEEDGPMAFGEIIAVAVSPDSLIAVADRFGCAVRIFTFPDGEAVRDLGGCGDGPGEVRRVVSMTFKGDTLVLFDYGRGRLLRWSVHGEEFRGDVPPWPTAEAPYAALDARPDRVLYAPNWFRTGTEELLVAAADDGHVAHGLRDAEISLTNLDQALGRSAGACLFQSQPRVAAVNPWALQAVILGDDLDALFNHVDDAPWPDPMPGGQPGAWTPPSFRPDVICGDSLALWRYRVNDLSGDLPRARHGFLMIGSSSGRVLLRETVEDTAWPHPTTMAPADALGDVFFFFHNGWGPYPAVRGFRVIPSGEMPQ